ncbi:MAG: hypothetical protein RL756_467 [Pseudomonadota bacterium]|jgi:hypothetical protein
MGRLTDAVAALTVAGGRAAVRLLPARVRKNLEDRLFYAIFQRTRVENDAYGWRPPEGGHADAGRVRAVGRP